MRTNHKSKPASSSSMLPAFAKGLGPAGVKRFPYINVVTSTVHRKRETLTHDLHNFELVSKITQTILDQGTVNEIDPKSSRGKRVHSHSMSVQAVVRALRQSSKEWRSVGASRVRTVLESYAQLTPGTIALVAPDPNAQAEGSAETDRSPIVQQTIDACSTVERLHEEAKKAAHLRFLPTLDHVAGATLRRLSHAEHSELSASIADATRFWQVSEHNVSEVSELVTRVETLARVANRGRYVTARLFGSRNYGLCSDQSDVDISVSVSPP
ncbi:hypothetical protein GGI24_007196, partial [Coemansia furcata]